MLIHPADANCFLIELADLKIDSEWSIIKENYASLKKIAEWALEFLCNPNQRLGREGPVCPFTKPALDNGFFWMTIYSGDQVRPDDAYAAVLKFRDWFPDLPEELAPQIIDSTQLSLKLPFVESGLMIGQFHSRCQESGLWNPLFRPLQSPVPLLAIRNMVSTDFPFLKSDIKYISAYFKRFASGVPDSVLDMVKDSLLRQDMSGQLPQIDSLTGLFKREHFNRMFELEYRRAARSSTPISLINIEIDDIKEYALAYGDAERDNCVKFIARAISGSLKRAGDIIFYNEEGRFNILLVGTILEGAGAVAEKIRAEIEGLAIPHCGAKDRECVTVSIGVVAGIAAMQLSPQSLTSSAQRAVSEASALGGNRVVISQD
jgi:diguanylate cyclase (GGDEF)-like protein